MNYIIPKIFTARVSCAEPERTVCVQAIQTWCVANGLPALEVTCVKDFGMIELWDDRAVQVEPNTGAFLGYSPRGLG